MDDMLAPMTAEDLARAFTALFKPSCELEEPEIEGYSFE